MLILLSNNYFGLFFIVACLAIMDGINFMLPHNSGFFSLTYGPDKLMLDAWHVTKIIMLIFIALKLIWEPGESNWQKNGLRLLAAGAIAFFTQLFVYNFLFKL